MLTIITPCSRPENLQTLHKSIDFDKIDKWIICYDTGKKFAKMNYLTQKMSYHERQVQPVPSFQFSGDSKIQELYVNGDIYGSVFGNVQRNIALDQVKDGYVYFLDDDNIMHPDFFKLNLDIPAPDNSALLYTFDVIYNCTIRKHKFILPGNTPRVGSIDISNICIHRSLIEDIKWKLDIYEADGHFIEAVAIKNQTYRYIKNVLGYKDYLKPS